MQKMNLYKNKCLKIKEYHLGQIRKHLVSLAEHKAARCNFEVNIIESVQVLVCR